MTTGTTEKKTKKVSKKTTEEKEIINWIRKGWRNLSRVQYFVEIEDKKTVGVIFWNLSERKGNKGILKIEIIVVKKNSKGIKRKLIVESLEKVMEYWKREGLKITAFYINTNQQNERDQKFYRKLSPDASSLISNVWKQDGKTGGIIQYWWKLK